ncbi:hypothetical protein JCM5350_000937 [Sporobolomyces pararoseus]
MADAPPDSGFSTRAVPTKRPNSTSSIKIKPLQAVLGSLPPVPLPPPYACRSRQRESEGTATNQAGVTIPSSSARSTIERTPPASIANHSRPGSSTLLPPIPSLPIPPPRFTGSLLRSSVQAQSVPGFNPLSFSTSPPEHYSAPSPLRSRPPSELEWFSPPVKSKPSPFIHQGGSGGGIRRNSSSSRSMERALSSSTSRPSPSVAPSERPRFSHSVSQGVILNNFHKRPRIEDYSSSASSSSTAPVNSRTIYEPIEQARQTRHPWRLPNGEDTDAALRMHNHQGFVRPTEIAKPSTPQAQQRPSFFGGHGATETSVYTTLWEDELTVVLSVEVNGHPVARRIDNNWINCTKLLNAAGLSRGKKDTILKNEENRQVFRRGASNLKGVWLPFESALRLAGQTGLLSKLYTLFAPNILTWLFIPLNLARTVSFVEACRDRSILKPGERDLYKLVVARQSVGLVPKDQLSSNAELECLRRKKRYLLTFLASMEMGLRSLGPIVSQVVVNRQSQPSRSSAPAPLAQIEEAQDEEGGEEQPQRQAVETTTTGRQNDGERPQLSVPVHRLSPSALADIRQGSISSPVVDGSLSAQPPVLPSNEPSTSLPLSALPPIQAHDWHDNSPPIQNRPAFPEALPSTPPRRSFVSNQPDQLFLENNDDSLTSPPSPSLDSTLPRHLDDPPLSPSSPITANTLPRSRSTSARSLLFDSNAAPSPSSSAWYTTAPTSRDSTVAPLCALDAVALALERDFPEWNSERNQDEEEEEAEDLRPSKRFRAWQQYEEAGTTEKGKKPEGNSRVLRERKEVKNYSETNQSGKSKTRPQMRGKR